MFDFPDITVTVNGTYYLVALCSDTDILWKASTANPYAGGQHHYSFDGGANWNGSAYDHAFRIYDSAVTTVPLTKSQAIRVRMEAKDSNNQTAQTVRDIWTNAYDAVPTVSLGSSALTGTTPTTFNLTATGADANLGTTWDGLLHYRWDVDGDGNFETEYDTASTKNASFALPGIYTATVEVRDRYYATARATVQLTVAPVTGATQMAVQAGENQSASINAAVTTAPAVIVKDASNNPVSGVVVVYSVLSGNGVVTAATQTTDGSGIATLGSWTLGSSIGAYTLSVNLPGFPQVSALTLHATAVGTVATTTTIASSLHPSSFGQSVTLTATVSPAGGTGNVTFKDGAATLGVVAVGSGGTAGLAVTTLTQGTHTLSAVYGGDASYLTSTSSDLSQLVNPAAPTISDLLATPSGISPAIAPYYGGAFTLTVRGANFVDGAVVVGYTTTFVSSTQLTAAIPASSLAALGTLSMKVRNPDNQESNTLSLKVIVRGDNNGNNSVNIGDALVCALIAGGINKPLLTLSVGDLNLSGAANIGDCLVLALFTGQINANLVVPLIGSVAPSTAVRGNTLTLTGTGFSATAAENEVLFTTTAGVTRVTPSSASGTSMVVTVPNTATSGPIQAYRTDVPLGGAEFPLLVSGEVTPLALTAVSPFFKVAVGASLTLTGLGFDAVPANNTVSFKSAGGPIGATVTSASTTSLTVTVPTGSICGTVTVTVGAQTSNARTVTVAGSSCAIQLSDMWGGGSPGETLVIEGGGFDIATPGNNIVKFAANGGGTVNAAVVMAGATQLHVRIPATAVQGNVTVTVGANTSNALAWTP